MRLSQNKKEGKEEGRKVGEEEKEEMKKEIEGRKKEWRERKSFLVVS